MQPRRYRTPLPWVVFLGFSGAGFLAGTVSLDIVYPDAGGAIISTFVIPLSLFFLAAALRPEAISADDAGLHLRFMFRNQHIPWEALQFVDVQAEPGSRSGPQLRATLRTGEVTLLPTPTQSGDTARRIAAELTEALREHAGPPAANGPDPAPSSE